MRPRAGAPQLKRGPLGAPELPMSGEPETLADLERGEPLNLALNVAFVRRVIESLPDGAGTERFVEAFIKEFRAHMPKGAEGERGGAGA